MTEEASSSSKDVSMTGTHSEPSVLPKDEPKFGGYTRFEIELEFVQCLAHPQYLNHLAVQKYYDDPAFVEYLKYLQYWSLPPYTKYLQYPGPTLKNLELLQQERFRREILSPHLVHALMEEGVKAAVPPAETS